MTRLAGHTALLALCALISWPANAEVQRLELISVAPGYGFSPSISDDGRFVAFGTGYETYVRDRVLGTSVRVSSDRWDRSFSISGDGRYVVFISDLNLTGEGYLAGSVWVRDLSSGHIELASVGVLAEYPDAWDAAISRDGRYVLFVSAKPFVANDVNQGPDVYLRDRALGTTEVISLDMAGQPAGYSEGSLSFSDDGRYVAFTSYSHELVNQPTENGGVYVRDRLLGTTELVSVNWDGKSVGAYGGTISRDGRFVAFLSPFWNMVQRDTNRATDVFVRDRQAHVTTRVSVTSTGLQANGPSSGPSLSTDGRLVAFISRASNLMPGVPVGDDGIFVHDRATGQTEFITWNDPRKGAAGAAITPDGDTLVLNTAKALVTADHDREQDVYVAELAATGAAYDFTLKPASLDFGDTALGSVATRNFWLRNRGTTALPLLRVFLRSGELAVFGVSHACGEVIAAGTGCAITVTFTPTATGTSTTKLVVAAGNRQVREREIFGTGVQP